MKVQFRRFFKHKKVAPLREQLLQPVSIYVGIVLATVLLYSIKITSLVPFTAREFAQNIGSASLSQIKHDVLFAPTKFAQFIVLKFGDNDAYIRLGSVFGVIFAAIILYAMLRKWHTNRISLLTTAMFLTSSWVLHAGRAASQEVLYLWVIPTLLLSCLWFLSKQHQRKLPLAAALLAVILYVPGSIILILAGAIAFHKYIIRNIRSVTTRLRLICCGIFVVGIAPLTYSFIGNKSQVSLWLGYDRMQDLTPHTIGHNFLAIPNELFWHGPADTGAWVLGTPILDIFSIAMLILGIYAYRAGYYPAREKLVFGSLILSILIIGFGGVVAIGLLIPLIYILIANGLAYMLQSWFTVFPKNPVARILGVVLLSLVVLVSCSYQLERYFVVWPNAADTVQTLKQGR